MNQEKDKKRVIYAINKIYSKPLFKQKNNYILEKDIFFKKAMNLILGTTMDKNLEVIPMLSLFSRINLNKRSSNKNKDKQFFNNPDKISAVINKPGLPENMNQKIDQLKTDFKNELTFFTYNSLRLNQLLLLTQKYFSNVTIKINKSMRDISFYDILINILSLTNILDQYSQEKPKGTPINFREESPFLLLGGDFSGLQDFIYTITSKGALKNLRSRSFFLELLTEHVVSEILDKLRLTRSNLIYAGGGRFYILATNTETNRNNINILREEINKWLLEKFQGKLYLALDSVKFNTAIFKKETEESFAEIWKEVGNRLSVLKTKKFNKQINKASEKDHSIMEPFLPAQSECSICKKLTNELYNIQREEDISVCKFCFQLVNMGKNLPKAKYIVASKTPASSLSHIPIMGVYYHICRSKNEIAQIENKKNIYVINSWEKEDYYNKACVQFLMGDYVAKTKKGGIKNFSTLAQEAVGTNRIAVLRMDVDNLGKIFIKGFSPEKRTLIRMSSLSLRLTIFFKYYINFICLQKFKNHQGLNLTGNISQKRNVTIIYSGGDDLFIVGSWDKIVELAYEINNNFRDYTCQNEDITISGGVVVQKPKKPLYRLAELAGEAEEEAKSGEKNSICLFYNPSYGKNNGENELKHTLPWPQAQNMVEKLVKPLVEDLSTTKKNRIELKIPRSFFNKLFKIIEKWRTSGILYLPSMAYNVSRMESSLKKRKDYSSLKATWFSFKNKLMDEKYLNQLYLSLNWIDLLQRGGDVK